MPRTDNHGSELEALPYALPVDLVGQVCESDIAIELFADDGSSRSGFGGLGKGRCGTVHLARGAVGGKGVAVCVGGNVRFGHL